MTHNENKNPFFQLITVKGWKVIKQLGLLIIICGSLYVLDNYYLKQNCEGQKTSLKCSLSPLVGDLGGNILQIAILIWFFEIGLRQESIKDMQEIFISTQPTKHIKGFYSKRADYKRLIEDSFDTATSSQEIKILCLSEEEVNFFTQQNLIIIRNKVIAGCQLKFLILHPQSCLLDCLDRVKFAEKATHKSLLEGLSGKLNQLVNMLEIYRASNQPIKGSIEVRFHKDLFSPIGYYSDSRNYRIVWMYFSDPNNGNEYPAFHISNKDLIDDAERHFDTLWQGSEKDILKVTQNNTNNKIKQIFQEISENK